MKRPIINRPTGFSLIEVLVTICIVSFGLLGLAAMFVRGIESSNKSFMQTVATQQAYDMADRMRANPDGVKAGQYEIKAEEQAEGAEGAEEPEENCPICTSCTPQALAAYDICTWEKQNASLLPDGRGTIENIGGNTYTIAVLWNGNRKEAISDYNTYTITIDP